MTPALVFFVVYFCFKSFYCKKQKTKKLKHYKSSKPGGMHVYMHWWCPWQDYQDITRYMSVLSQHLDLAFLSDLSAANKFQCFGSQKGPEKHKLSKTYTVFVSPEERAYLLEL